MRPVTGPWSTSTSPSVLRSCARSPPAGSDTPSGASVTVTVTAASTVCVPSPARTVSAYGPSPPSWSSPVPT